MSSINIFDVIVAVAGLYMAFCGIQMKSKGKINTGVVLSKNITADQIKDKEGFIAYMWWKLVVVGLMVAVSGIFNMSAVALFGETPTVVIIELVINAIFFILLIIYGVIVVKAQKKYMNKY